MKPGILVEGQVQNRTLYSLVEFMDVCTPGDDYSPARIQAVWHPLQPMNLRSFPHLKVVCRATTGRDGLQNVDTNRVRLLTLESAELKSVTCTAEMTLGLIIAADRQLPAVTAAANRGIWSRYACPMPPRMLSESDLLIVGSGRLACLLYERALPLFRDVNMWSDGSESTLVEMVRDSHFISIHASPRSYGPKLVGEKILRAAHPDAILINTSHAEILDHAALVEAIDSGWIRGAALDSLPGEFDNTLPRVSQMVVECAKETGRILLSQHTAGSVKTAREYTENLIVEKLREVFS